MKIEQLRYMIPILEKEVERKEVPGVRVSVILKGEECFHYSAGYADTLRHTPMMEDTIIRLFSMSKPITAVAAMILYERGQLDLFAPVSSYLEGFIDQKVYTEQGLVEAVRPVKVCDLLNMTSPILYPDDTEGNVIGNQYNAYYEQIRAEMRKNKQTSTKDFVNGLSQIPLAFQPGDHWAYSASADILGAVIEAIAGMPYGDFLKKELFEPLGMVDTGFYVPKDKVDRFTTAQCYNCETKQMELYNDNHLCVGDWLSPPAFESGGAGLVSTMKDYTRFAKMMLYKGTLEGTRILGEKTVQFMTSNQLTGWQKRTVDWESMLGYGYGNLFRTLEHPSIGATNGAIGEFGWDGWMGNYFFVDPADELIFLYFIQAADSPCIQEDRRKLRQILYGSL